MTVTHSSTVTAVTAPRAKGPLGRYRLLSPTASVRVSPLCLGGMNFGNAWKGYMGTCDQNTTESILDSFYSQGGNFLNTSNNYQAEESERWIGEWMKKRGVRDQMVVATKFSTNFHAGRGDKEIIVNFNGNGTKSLHTSVHASLEKLQTTYIDLLYVHWWDFGTSIPELMQSLNHLVAAEKVLFLGVSDTPAWVVSKANEYARNHGLRPFSVYQGRWNAASRDFERDILPMCHAEGMGIAPWGALGGGTFVSEARDEPIALTYVTSKAPYVFPIVGGRTIDHLRGNIEALTIRLSEEEIREIEAAVPFDLGFPMNFLYGGSSVVEHPGAVWFLQMGGELEHVPEPKPLSKA
ncbi:norsolorinic acid reductase [Aspergillus brunneoviolaceus CBS 621.78]|uniref:Norsolorinic acid reductase n=1 Tax=Aspergillus brunneoviolaceus CBS 621.78 TaxID=1450534 RepID=A0ACD1G8S7_9EURO|nr:norsolorinic acid reductase [Aspergillus brunneoviolaceus CBS 621.78]RAH45526.1 norsolorinic acid reductase [Aspergillus brunneoviolaceus CBS 621.78]